MAGEGIIGSWRRLNLVGRIAIGLVAAVCVALLTRWLGGGAEGWEAVVARTKHVPEGWPAWVLSTGELLGDLFVGALKAVAPVLVFALVMAAIAQHQRGTETNIRPVHPVPAGHVRRGPGGGVAEFPVSLGTGAQGGAEGQ